MASGAHRALVVLEITVKAGGAWFFMASATFGPCEELKLGDWLWDEDMTPFISPYSVLSPQSTLWIAAGANLQTGDAEVIGTVVESVR